MRLIYCALAVSVLGTIAGCGGGGGASAGSGGGGSTGPTSTAVTVKFNGTAPAAVATRIGTDAFAAASLSSGALSLTIPSGQTNFSVAIKCPTITQASGTQTSTSTNEIVMEASTADGTSFTMTCPSAPALPPTDKLTGTLDASAVPGVNYLNVSGAVAGSAGMARFIPSSSSTFSVDLPAGTDRVALGGYVYSASNPSGADTVYTLAALRNFDNVSVPGSVNGGAPVLLGPGDAVTKQPITYSNVPSDYGSPSTFAYYLWKNGGGVWLSNGAISDYPAVPPAAVEAGDYYSFSVTAYSRSTVGEAMAIQTTATSAGPQTFTFPAPWKYAGPAPAALPSFNMAYGGFAGKAGVVDSAVIAWSTGMTNLDQNSVTVLASLNYLNGSTTVAIPDLSGTAGFLGAPASGTHLIWSALVFQSSGGILQPSASAGTFVAVENGGTFVVP